MFHGQFIMINQILDFFKTVDVVYPKFILLKVSEDVYSNKHKPCEKNSLFIALNSIH